MEADSVAAAPITTTSAVSTPSSPPHEPGFSPIGSLEIAVTQLKVEEEATHPSTTTTSAIYTPSSPPHEPGFSPVGSLEIADTQLKGEEEEEEATHPSGGHQHPQISSQLTDDLRDKIIKQVEYYFSDENLPTDKYLMNYVTQNVEGFVPIAVIASFRKMKKLTQDRSLIVSALKDSSLLVVSSNRKRIKRIYSLPVSAVTDPQLCTVLVANLPEDHSTENIQKIFGEAGTIKNICIRDPCDASEPRKRTTAEKLLSGKLHALVEYETIDAAEKAVATLNNEQDWRYGMRVKFLKRAVKHEQKKKGRRDVDFEKNGENKNLSEHLGDTRDKKKGDRSPKLKNGYKTQRRRWGRGRGTICYSPPLSPIMPYRTRGFSIGRGRTPSSNERRVYD